MLTLITSRFLKTKHHLVSLVLVSLRDCLILFPDLLSGLPLHCCSLDHDSQSPRFRSTCNLFICFIVVFSLFVLPIVIITFFITSMIFRTTLFFLVLHISKLYYNFSHPSTSSTSKNLERAFNCQN